MTEEKNLQFQDWGLIEYSEALERMQALQQDVIEGRIPDGILVFCTHPAVVTLGRATQPGDVFGWQGPVLEISRGGRATYHGPSQIVIYPIMNLRPPRKNRGPQEIAGFLRELEDGIVELLQDYGVKSQGRSLQKKNPTESGADETGVWVENRKIASLGISVKRWVTAHGAALNVDHDPKAFTGMNPCGFQKDVMISLEELLGHPIDRKALSTRLREILLRRL